MEKPINKESFAELFALLEEFQEKHKLSNSELAVMVTLVQKEKLAQTFKFPVLKEKNH